jgi:ubiquinone/menaquinone biosynthesis C-methylase UbiE
MNLDDLLLRMFGRPRGLLGRVGGCIMAHTKRTFTPWAIGLLEIQPGDRVLEVGFGPGAAIRRLAESTPAGFIAGVDPSREMLQQARTRNAKALRAGRVDLRQGSAECLPFEEHSFDKVLSINSLQVWSDTRTGLREIHRVLKKGGQLALGFTVHSRQSRTGLVETLAAAGFGEVRLIETDQGFGLVAKK